MGRRRLFFSSSESLVLSLPANSVANIRTFLNIPKQALRGDDFPIPQPPYTAHPTHRIYIKVRARREEAPTFLSPDNASPLMRKEYPKDSDSRGIRAGEASPRSLPHRPSEAHQRTHISQLSLPILLHAPTYIGSLIDLYCLAQRPILLRGRSNIGRYVNNYSPRTHIQRETLLQLQGAYQATQVRLDTVSLTPH